MAHFLIGGGGFQNIVRDFGRPPVSQWIGLAAVRGSRSDGRPVAASRSIAALPQPSTGDAAVSLDDAVASLHALAAHPDLHTAALALDPRDWRLLRFTLWHGPVPETEPAGERYEVLHLSAPEWDQLSSDRAT